MAIWASKTLSDWAQYYGVHPNFMFLVFTIWNETVQETAPTGDVYTVRNLGAFNDFVKTQQQEFMSVKDVAETYKHRLSFNLLYSSLTMGRSFYKYMETGKHNAFVYKTNYIDDPEHNFYFLKSTLFQFIDMNCPEELTMRQLGTYSGKGAAAFWSKKYDALPENLRSRWFFEESQHKKYFRSIHFDELMHYFSLRSQARRQEYAATLDPVSPASFQSTDNQILEAKLGDITAEKIQLEQRLAELNERLQKIILAMAANNIKKK